MFFKRNFPKTRLRRLRQSNEIRDLVSETHLSLNDLIQPIFITDNKDMVGEISLLEPSSTLTAYLHLLFEQIIGINLND